MWDKLKSIISIAAPTIATALGGPGAGAAVALLAKTCLGKDSATEEEIATALQNPEVMLKLKEAEYNFKIQMEQADIQKEEIALRNTDSARKRQTDTKDITPTIMSYIITFGFFAVIFVLVSSYVNISPGDKDLLCLLVGQLASRFNDVCNFQFGGVRRIANAAIEKFRND